MFGSPAFLKEKAQVYCRRLGIALGNQLGLGLQGIVFLTSNNSALKVHARQADYERELKVFSRLLQHNVQEVRGFRVPQLRAFDNQLFIIEMSVVAPPFIVDFGGAYLDEPPPHARDSADKARWADEREERFGQDAATVNALLADFETLYGIYLTDVHRSNIQFKPLLKEDLDA